MRRARAKNLHIWDNKNQYIRNWLTSNNLLDRLYNDLNLNESYSLEKCIELYKKDPINFCIKYHLLILKNQNNKKNKKNKN